MGEAASPPVQGSGRRPNQNAPRWRRFWRDKPKPKQRAGISRRERGKRRRGIKRLFKLNRRQMGAIGAGHMAAPWEVES